MKKAYFMVVAVWFATQLSGQDHVHWGSTGDPLNGLTVTWHSTGASDKIKWGYTAAYEQGTFPGVRRSDYSGNLYDYTFPAVNASSTIHYSLFSNTGTLDIQVAGENDDMEQYLATGLSDPGSSDLELCNESGGDQIVGMRFNKLAIPNGATITKAWVVFEADEVGASKNINPCMLTIKGQAADNAPEFAKDSVTPNLISGRPTTTASVTWSPPDWMVEHEKGAGQTTPDIKAIIQEIVSRSGWASGNSIVILITGTGRRYAEAFEGEPAGGPILHIEYTPSVEGWAPDKTFQTSVGPNSTRFSFIAGGDSRTNWNDWATSANKLAAESADFHLFLGDHVTSGTSTSDWNTWYAMGANFLGTNLIYHTGGNHEYGPIYLNQFVMPGNEKWYSFEFGNALFICLLSQEDYSTQQTWLVNVLSATKKTWKVVFFHKPFFTTGSHANDMNSYQGTWWKAFDDYNVDVVLGGHTHYYLRAKPINLNVSSASPVAEYGSNPGQGRLQVVAGSYGAPLAGTGTGWFVDKNMSVLNYTKFVIDDNVMKMSAYNMTGTLIDSVTLSKKGATGVTAPGTTSPAEWNLMQNFPNPFNASTTIHYSLPKSEHVDLKLLDFSGREIDTLIKEHQTAGQHEAKWTAEGLPSGLYFYRLQAGGFVETKKLILIK